MASLPECLTQGTTALRLLFCDAGGIRRCRVLPASAFDGLETGVGLTRACMALPCFADMLAPGSGLAPVGEVRLVPDLSTGVLLPWCPSHAMALCDLLVPGSLQPWACCPRAALRRALEALHARHGLDLLVGFELEFLLLTRGQAAAGQASGGPAPEPGSLQATGWQPLDQCVYSSAAALDAAAPVLDEVVAALQGLGLGVVQWHGESAHGQYEVALAPLPALQAADKLLLAREAVGSVARGHGLAASFHPKPLPGQAGSGCHCHFSLLRDGANVMTAAPAGDGWMVKGAEGRVYPTLSEEASRAVAGLLAHLPALLPFTSPSTASYARLAPSCWAGAYACWGWENREAALRLALPGGRQSANVEVKAFDGSANPHLGLAALVTGLLLGLDAPEGGAAPSLPPPVASDPADLAPGERGPALPGSLEAALDALAADPEAQHALGAVLGADLLAACLAVRRCEAAHAQSVADALLQY